MLERSKKPWLWAALSLVVLATTLSHSQAEQREPIKPKNPSGRRPDEAAGNISVGTQQAPRAQTAKAPIERYTFWLMLATLGLVAIGGLQVWTFTESERARLLVESVSFMRGEPDAANGGLSLVFQIKNFGKNIARVQIFKVEPAVSLHKKPLPMRPIYNEDSVMKLTVAPVAPDTELTVLGNNGGMGGPLTAPPIHQLVEQIKNGDVLMRVWGEIKYDPGYFPIQWGASTGFCFEYIPQSRRVGPAFQVCDNPNYTYAK